MVEWTKQAEGAVGVTGALFRRGAESDDPGAIVEAARYDSAVIVLVGGWTTSRIESVVEVVSLLARGNGVPP